MAHTSTIHFLAHRGCATLASPHPLPRSCLFLVLSQPRELHDPFWPGECEPSLEPNARFHWTPDHNIDKISITTKDCHVSAKKHKSADCRGTNEANDCPELKEWLLKLWCLVSPERLFFSDMLIFILEPRSTFISSHSSIPTMCLSFCEYFPIGYHNSPMN